MSDNQIKSNFYVFVMEGAAGSVDHAVVEEGCDTICLLVRDKHGNKCHFESDAYHLERFCKEHGLGYQKIMSHVSFVPDTKVPE